MAGSQKRRDCAAFFRLLPYLALAAACAFSLLWFARYGSHNQNADLSAEMILADLLNEEGRLLTDSWTYSTELRVVSPTPFYQLGLALFPSWHAARTFAVAAMLALTLAAFLFLARGLGMGEAGVWCAAALALPFCDDYRYFFIYGLFYSMYWVLVLLVLGLLARYVRRGKPVYAALALPLALYGGLGGVRMTLVCAVPLVLACLPDAVCRLASASTPREAVRSREGRLLLCALAVSAACLAGYAFNHLVLSARYNYAHFESLALVPLDWQALGDQLRGVLRYFGYRSGAPVLSLRGASGVSGLFLAAFALLGARRLARGGDVSPERRLAAGFALTSLVTGIAVNVLTGMETVGYYIFALTLLVVLLYAALDQAPCRMRWLKRAGWLALTAVFALHALVYLRTDMETEPSASEQAADYLLQEGYTQGYATFWNASPLTEASDGALEVIAVTDWQTLVPDVGLQKNSHLTQRPEGPVFALLFWDEVTPSLPEAFTSHLLAELDAGCAYGFESDEALRLALGVEDGGIE